MEATLVLLTDMGPNAVKGFKKIWATARQNFRLLSYSREGNEKTKNIYASYACGQCDFEWCTAAHIYCKELPEEYHKWLAKKWSRM